MFGALDISTSGLIAQRTRLEAVDANVANANSIYDAKGKYAPYRRRIVELAPGDPATGNGAGVHVSAIKLDQSPFRRKYEPGHPNADSRGYVNYPNVNPEVETINSIEIIRAYEANIAAAEATKSVMQSTLRLLA